MSLLDIYHNIYHRAFGPALSSHPDIYHRAFGPALEFVRHFEEKISIRL